ncbi:glycoside hydrolase family 72 protein [Acrodontium crateriforme]|uniref:1,3-beta-glucanosyltransferase n=1 Tax=Acrodontium crateriforme TaxID=150365 RepID=A0AAQ3R8C4_9PEZI|nr:glycoside hydrolase family 72 protein [Acrodontium crateriforme]
MRLFPTFSVAAALFQSTVLGKIAERQQGRLPVVSTRGNAFYAEGERFYIRGVAYQPGGAADAADPLLDLETLQGDIRRFKDLGINTIRIYTIDNSANHDKAMALLDDAGIYLALDVNTPRYSLNRESLASLHASYNDVYLQSVFATVDAFAGYNNLLVFFSGNEVINAHNNTNAAPYIKAVTRDMKQYIAAQAPRSIPVGYSAADVAENIEPQALYFACGPDETARSDFFAFNDYSWCDPSSFVQSGWDKKVQTYSDYSLPIFLSEFGCITNTREWNEIESLYSQNMTSVYSGGLAYEYTVEPNGYGLVEAGSNGEVVPNGDFKLLKKALAGTPNPSGSSGARTSTSVPPCPPESREWQLSTLNLPKIPTGAKKYIRDGAGTGPGLAGDESSQWMGTPSETRPDLKDGVETSEILSKGISNSGNRNGSATSDNNNESSAASFTRDLGLVFTVSVAASAMIL